MSENTRGVPGIDAASRAANLAGVLAELGQVSLVVVGGGTRRTLAPRVTDLPGTIVAELLHSPEVALEVPGLGATFLITPRDISWSTEDPRTAALLGSALSRAMRG